MLQQIVCRIFGHRIDRRHVWFDDLDFRTDCGRCGTAMVRTLHGWREFDSDSDHDEARLGHPRDR